MSGSVFSSLVTELGSVELALDVVTLAREPFDDEFAALDDVLDRYRELSTHTSNALSSLSAAVPDATASVANSWLWSVKCVDIGSSEQAQSFANELSLSNFSLIWAPANP